MPHTLTDPNATKGWEKKLFRKYKTQKYDFFDNFAAGVIFKK
jgi:hypothetical protein